MISPRSARTTVLWMSLLLAAACQRQQPQIWRASDPTYVPFDVREIVVSANNRVVGVTVDERPANEPHIVSGDLPVYLLDLKTGNHHLLGSNGVLLPTLDDQFIYSESERSSKPPVLITGVDTVRTFEIGESNGAWWNSKTSTVIFETGWPKDVEGFNTLTLLKPAIGTTTTVHVQQTSELLGVCPATGNFYTEHRFANGELGVDEYDGNGKFIGNTHSPLAIYSANCRYVLPFAVVGAHGPDVWGVYEASTRTMLMDFPWKEDGKTDLHWFKAWNPRHDNLLLMYSQEARTKMDTIDLLDVSKRAVVKNWPSPEGSPPVRWSGDGEATVTVRDHHIVFESLGGIVVDSSTK